MTIDYTLIADNDPGGDLETAYATMFAETVVNERSNAVFNDRDIAMEVGFTLANQFLDDLEAAAPARIMRWIETIGLDLAHQDVIDAITNIAPRNLSVVLALKDETLPRYGVSFNEGHLQSARELRAVGRV